MADDSTTAQSVITNFNDEVIWDNNKDLFGMYFRDHMAERASRFAFYPLNPQKSFNENMAVMGFVIGNSGNKQT